MSHPSGLKVGDIWEGTSGANYLVKDIAGGYVMCFMTTAGYNTRFKTPSIKKILYRANNPDTDYDESEYSENDV